MATLLTYRQSNVLLEGLSIKMANTLDRKAGKNDTVSKLKCPMTLLQRRVLIRWLNPPVSNIPQRAEEEAVAKAGEAQKGRRLQNAVQRALNVPLRGHTALHQQGALKQPQILNAPREALVVPVATRCTS